MNDAIQGLSRLVRCVVEQAQVPESNSGSETRRLTRRGNIHVMCTLRQRADLGFRVWIVPEPGLNCGGRWHVKSRDTLPESTQETLRLKLYDYVAYHQGMLSGAPGESF